MNRISYHSKIPTVKEYQALRRSVGWEVADDLITEKALSNTLFAVCAYANDDAIIGSGRVVGDGALAFYIQDLMVIPDYQRKPQGVGVKMMHLIMEYIKSNASPYSDIGGMSAKGVETFYQKFGFIERPDSHFGAGMTYILTTDSLE